MDRCERNLPYYFKGVRPRPQENLLRAVSRFADVSKWLTKQDPDFYETNLMHTRDMMRLHAFYCSDPVIASNFPDDKTLPMILAHDMQEYFAGDEPKTSDKRHEDMPKVMKEAVANHRIAITLAPGKMIDGRMVYPPATQRIFNAWYLYERRCIDNPPSHWVKLLDTIDGNRKATEHFYSLHHGTDRQISFDEMGKREDHMRTTTLGGLQKSTEKLLDSLRYVHQESESDYDHAKGSIKIIVWDELKYYGDCGYQSLVDDLKSEFIAIFEKPFQASFMGTIYGNMDPHLPGRNFETRRDWNRSDREFKGVKTVEDLY